MTTEPADSPLTLDIVVGDERRSIELSAAMIEDARPLLAAMDRDMDGGWRLGRDFLEAPDAIQRCQVAADRLLSALHRDDLAVQSLMAAYILVNCPGVRTVDINTAGEMLDTLFYDAGNCPIG